MKHQVLLSLAALFAQNVLALPSPDPQSSLGPRVSRAPDKCGPLVQGDGDPLDTCLAKPSIVPTAAAFGILESRSDKPGAAHDNSPYDWKACDPTVKKICQAMARGNMTAGAWHFENGPYNFPNEGDMACQMGFWLPNNALFDTTKVATTHQTSSDGTAAFKPTEQQCQVIFAEAVNAAVANYPKWIGASINLVKNPEGVPGPNAQWALPGGAGTGQAFNSGYPSYVVAANQQRSCSDANGRPCICSNDGASCLELLKDCVNPSTGESCVCAAGTGWCAYEQPD